MEKISTGKYPRRTRSVSFLLYRRLPAVLLAVVCSILIARGAVGAGLGYPSLLNSVNGYPFPNEYGSIIYTYNENSPKQLYIIGMSHRDTLTGLNGAVTVDSQIEVYRITEGLIKNQGLNLVLPEGYFSRRATDDQAALVRHTASGAGGISLDASALKRRLANDAAHANAEILLMESYGIDLQPVEDIDLYNAVITRVRDLEKEPGLIERLFIRSELDYLQKRRVAAMLQNIPGVINGEFRKGSISTQDAVFTIGMHHLAGIIRYLQNRRIDIPSPAFTSFEDYTAEMSLLHEDFGVTVIVPSSLADARDLILLSRLETKE